MPTNGSPEQEVAASLFPFNFSVDSQTADTFSPCSRSIMTASVKQEKRNKLRPSECATAGR